MCEHLFIYAFIVYSKLCRITERTSNSLVQSDSATSAEALVGQFASAETVRRPYKYPAILVGRPHQCLWWWVEEFTQDFENSKFIVDIKIWTTIQNELILHVLLLSHNCLYARIFRPNTYTFTSSFQTECLIFLFCVLINHINIFLIYAPIEFD